jgi:hypothetical protein
MRTHLLPKGVSIAPMPPLRKGEVDRKTQGGLPPEPYRNANRRWGTGAKSAREPFVCKQIKREVLAGRKDFD